MSVPLWLWESAVDRDCADCPAVIPAGDPAAYVPDDDDGAVVCFECGCQLEDQAEQTGVAT